MARGSYKIILPQVARNISEAATQAFQATATECANRIIDRTPVKTGLARGNTQIAINTAEMSATGTLDPDGGTARTRAAGVAQLLKIGDAAVIGNPLDYVEALENGSSSQAPAGMYGLTEQEVPRIWDREFRGAMEQG